MSAHAFLSPSASHRWLSCPPSAKLNAEIKDQSNDTEYLDINNYTLTKKNYAQINRLVHSMQKAIALPSQYTYISHHANTYGNVPLWVAMNAFTFGQASKMFQYITNDVQYKISQKFEHITERELHQFITVLARCRNVCAHGERLFSFRIHETIPNTLLHKKLQISQKNGNYLYGKQDLFAVVIVSIRITAFATHLPVLQHSYVKPSHLQQKKHICNH